MIEIERKSSAESSNVEKRPWVLDEEYYMIMTKYNDENNYECERIKRRDFIHHRHKNELLYNRYNKMLKYKRFIGWKCFYTGIKCIYPIKNEVSMREKLDEIYNKVPWIISKDHMSPKYHYSGEQPEYTHTPVNMVLTGYALNRRFAHAPLAFKLHMKNIFIKEKFDEYDHSKETFEKIKATIIRESEDMKFKNKLPWQPWTYSERERIELEKFLEEIKSVEKEVLSLKTDEERVDYMKDFTWKW